MAIDAAIGAKATATATEEAAQPAESGEEELEMEEEDEAPTHLPLAPPSVLGDTSTTVDPSCIISLIRKLLPRDEKKQDAIEDCNRTKETKAMEASNDLVLNDNLTRDNGDGFSVDREDLSASSQSSGKCQEFQEEERNGASDSGHTTSFETKDPWEECGCILWDLSANKTHAKLMVDNLLLEVLLVSLRVSKSLRVTEICLGIIGNLACHDDLSNTVVSKGGLVEMVVQQLFLNDSTCLSETFRLLVAALQGNNFDSWAEALQPDQVLLRVLWIIENTLNSLLLEKGIEFLLAIINNEGVSRILLQPLIEQGLPKLVDSLLACERSKLGDESKLERSSTFELVLDLVEALSATDSYSQVIASNEELLPLLRGLVMLRDKFEVANSWVSVTIIIANLLVDDEQRLARTFSRDIPFLGGFLDILPFVSAEPQAQNAFWCIMQKIMNEVQECDIPLKTFEQYAWLFANKCYLIELHIKRHPAEELPDSPTSRGYPSSPMANSLRRIGCVIEKWLFEKPALLEMGMVKENKPRDEALLRLLEHCRKYRMAAFGSLN